MIYLSTACFKEKKMEKILSFFADNKVLNVELSGGTDYCADLAEILGDFRRRYQMNYAFHAYFPPPKQDFVINLASCNDEIYYRSIAHYKEALKMMKTLESRTLSVHAGFLVEILPQEIGKKLECRRVYDRGKAIDRFCDACSTLRKEAEKDGILFYIENNVISRENFEAFNKRNLLLMTDYEAVMEMKKQMPFHFLLDLGHLHVSANTLGMNFREQAGKMKSITDWIHVSENNGIVDEHKIIRLGSEIYATLIDLMERKCPITIEANGERDSVMRFYAMITELEESIR